MDPAPWDRQTADVFCLAVICFKEVSRFKY
jgi:hypothetical protein